LPLKEDYRFKVQSAICSCRLLPTGKTFYRDAVDPEYQLWHKLDSHVGPDKSEWGYWVHTFDVLLSPKEYGESHPEYFSFL
jgi:hypothetical protein